MKFGIGIFFSRKFPLKLIARHRKKSRLERLCVILYGPINTLLMWIIFSYIILLIKNEAWYLTKSILIFCHLLLSFNYFWTEFKDKVPMSSIKRKSEVQFLITILLEFFFDTLIYYYSHVFNTCKYIYLIYI